jgi:hypothetical protein
VARRGGAPCPLRDVRLSSAVERVELVPGGAGVRVWVRGCEAPLGAHAAVCTLPLGVLQAGRVAFSPPLPAFKAEAMAGLAMGTENRVAMVFDKASERARPGGWMRPRHFLSPLPPLPLHPCLLPAQRAGPESRSLVSSAAALLAHGAARPAPLLRALHLCQPPRAGLPRRALRLGAPGGGGRGGVVERRADGA